MGIECDRRSSRHEKVAYPHSAVEGRAGLTPLPDSGLPSDDRSASHLFGITLDQQFYAMNFSDEVVL
jgi:hypothetical protein